MATMPPLRTPASLPVTTRTSKVRQVALSLGFRSGFEQRICDQLVALGIDPKFESTKIEYITPATKHKYTPDFPLADNLIVETKGRFMPADRKKHLLLKAQHPELDIRLVFERSKTPISKGSKTTYAMWCDQNGIKYADKLIPAAWLNDLSK